MMIIMMTMMMMMIVVFPFIDRDICNKIKKSNNFIIIVMK